MPAHDVPERRPDFAWIVRQVAVEKFPKRPFADKTDAGAVLLGEIGQPVVFRDASHIALIKMPDGKQCPGQLSLVEPVEKIALVLRSILTLEQLEYATRIAHLGIMAC